MCKPTTSSPTVVNRNTMPMPIPTMKRQQQQPSSAPSSFTLPSTKTTDRKVIRHASVADGGRIRSRFLDRLGISPPVPRSKGRRVGTSCNLPSSSNTTRRTRPLMKRQQETSKQELLKKDHGQPDESLGPSSYSQTSVSPKNSTSSHAFGHRNVKTVSFANAVEVISIPSHQAYSDRIKNTVWTNPTERKQNYARNVLEFSAENWDYRQVVEEDQFYLVATAGAGSQKNRGKQQEVVMVHPVHLYLQQQQRERQLRWQSFCAVMSAQQKQQQHHQHAAMNY